MYIYIYIYTYIHTYMLIYIIYIYFPEETQLLADPGPQDSPIPAVRIPTSRVGHTKTVCYIISYKYRHVYIYTLYA